MHAGCVAQLPRLSARWLPAAVRPPEMCGLRTRPRTDVDPPRVGLPSAAGISSRRPRGDNLFSTLTDFVRLARRCAADTALAVARCLCLSVSVCRKSELCRTTIGRIERDFRMDTCRACLHCVIKNFRSLQKYEYFPVQLCLSRILWTCKISPRAHRSSKRVLNLARQLSVINWAVVGRPQLTMLATVDRAWPCSLSH